MVDKYCDGCRYLALLGGAAGSFCDYIGATGKRRGCPTGAGCTKRKEDKRRRLPQKRIKTELREKERTEKE